MTNVMVKKCFLLFNGSLLQLVPIDVCLHLCCTLIRQLKMPTGHLLSVFPLHTDQTWLSHPLLKYHTLQPPMVFGGPLLDLFQHVSVLLQRSLKLDAGLQVRSHEYCIEGKGHFP